MTNYCENMKMYYMRRYYVGLCNDFDVEMMKRHIASCPECMDRFIEMRAEDGIKNMCLYVQDNMYKYQRGLLHSLIQETEIGDHLKSCSKCREYRKSIIRNIQKNQKVQKTT